MKYNHQAVDKCRHDWLICGDRRLCSRCHARESQRFGVWWREPARDFKAMLDEIVATTTQPPTD